MLLNSSVHQTGTPTAASAAKPPISISANIANELQSNLNLIDGKKTVSPIVMSSSLTSEPDANNNTLSKIKRIMDTSDSKSPTTTGPSSKSQFSAKSVEDDSYFAEEDKGDCVYVITYKKVYNKGLGTPRPSYGQLPSMTNSGAVNSLYTEQPSVNPYGTYRLLTPLFSQYQEGGGSDQQSTASATAVAPNCDGLVYSRVKIKQLKYASLVKFVEHFTSDDTGELDSNLVQTFLATYRTFTDTQTVLKLLKQRYEQILPASLDMTEDVRLESLRSIKAFVRMWLESYGEDFAEPPDYPNLNELNRFAHSHLNDAEIIKIIRAKFEQFEANEVGESESAATLDDNINRNTTTNLSTDIIPTREKLIMSDNIERSAVSNHRRSYSNLAQPSQVSLSSSRLNSNHSRSQVSLDQASMSKLMLFSSPSSNLDDNNNTSMSIAVSSLLSIDSRFIAEQLTYIDKKLFQRIYAYHCLASVWGTRYQKTNNAATSSHQKSNSGSSTAELTQSTMSTQSTVGGLITPTLADKFASMRAFIDQFNLVSFVVQGTILEKFDLKPVERAKIINKWIEIALECRKLKNFSSLNAIVQGLNTQCVSRLVKTWNEVAPDLKMQFNQLTEMFSQDQNQKIFREILMKDLNEYKELFGSNDNISNINNNNNKINSNKNDSIRLNQMEGTAKYAEIESGINATLSKKMKEKMMQKKNYEARFKEPIGTVPFLGTFLKDLEYINAKNYQKNEKGLINVMQKRREFEIIAQIKLLQQASYLYSMKPDDNFEKWLGSLPTYSEVQNYELSYMIEPKFDRDVSSNSSGSNPRKIKNGLSQYSRSESVDSISSSNPVTNCSNSKTPSSITRNQFKNGGLIGGTNTPLLTHGVVGGAIFPGHLHSRNSSMGSASDMVGPGAGEIVKSSLIDSIPSDNQSTNTSAASVDAPFNSKYYGTMGNGKAIESSSELRVKVNMDTGDHAGTVMYKKMSINDKYRTKDVKRLILEKFFFDPNLSDTYTLIQILGGGKELVINDNCNVFYAAKNIPDMQFVLRKKNAIGGLSSMSSTIADSTIPNGGNGLQHQAKYMRHSFANLNQANSSQQTQSKSSRWWLKKILS